MEKPVKVFSAVRGTQHLECDECGETKTTYYAKIQDAKDHASRHNCKEGHEHQDDDRDMIEDHGPGCDGPLNCTCECTEEHSLTIAGVTVPYKGGAVWDSHRGWHNH